MSNTGQLAKAAALELLPNGQRRTAERVRQAIGQGAQQTILSALRLRDENDQLRASVQTERDGRERDQTAWLQQVDKARQDLKTANADRKLKWAGSRLWNIVSWAGWWPRACALRVPGSIC